MESKSKSDGKSGLFWLAAPLVICLPCLLPVIAVAVAAGIGTGTVGSFFSDNAILIAIAASAAMVVALVVGWWVSRLRQRAGAVRFLSRDG